MDESAIAEMERRVRSHRYDTQYSRLPEDERRRAQAMLTEEFWTDLLEATGLAHHPKRHIVRQATGGCTTHLEQCVVVGMVAYTARVLHG